MSSVYLPESVGEADITDGGMKKPCVQGGRRDGHCLLSNVQRVVRTICRGACVYRHFKGRPQWGVFV